MSPLLRMCVDSRQVAEFLLAQVDGTDIKT